MRYEIIATGSQGNALILNEIMLVDCGVSFKALKGAYKQLQIVLLTHIHGDHFNCTTIRALARERPTLRFACCKWLVGDLLACNVAKQNIDVLEIGKMYDYGAFKVSPIKLYHDAPQCGYRLFFGEERSLYVTDTGHLNGITAKDYDYYFIEANYGEQEIQERIAEKQSQGLYCYELGVLNRHLSKEQADAFLLENMGENSRYIYMHGHKGADE